MKCIIATEEMRMCIPSAVNIPRTQQNHEVWCRGEFGPSTLDRDNIYHIRIQAEHVLYLFVWDQNILLPIATARNSEESDTDENARWRRSQRRLGGATSFSSQWANRRQPTAILSKRLCREQHRRHYYWQHSKYHQY
jgi:hypothetical protein